MKKDEQMLHMLTDLIKVNYDRIHHYEKAAGGMGSSYEVKHMLYNDASLGRRNVNELHAQIIKLGGRPVTGAQAPGQLYSYWKQKYSPACEYDAEMVIANRKKMEDAIISVYQEALEEDRCVSFPVRSMIRYQQHLLRESRELSTASFRQFMQEE